MPRCPRPINEELYRDEWIWQEGEYTVYRNCQYTAPGCHNGCGVLHYVKDNKLVKIEGDPKGALSNGRLCMRCLAMEEMVNHPFRIYNPMKRDPAKRGDDDAWEVITWDEAYDLYVEKAEEILGKYGKKSFCILGGTGRNTTWQFAALATTVMGSPNYTFGFLSGNSCYVPRMNVCFWMGGDVMVADCAQCVEEGYDHPDYVNPEVCVIWCCNPIVSNADGFFGHWIVDLMRMGTKLIVIDPRLTWMGAQAEYYLQIKPGTDGALALGWINVIIAEDLYDHDFVEKWTYGFDQLAARAAEYPPERVAEITGIPADLIVASARRYATAKPASVQWGLKFDQFKNGFGAAMGCAALWALTGNIDVPGGNIVVNTGFISGDARRMFSGMKNTAGEEFDMTERLGQDEFVVEQMGLEPQAHPDSLLKALETGEPYPIKFLFEQSSNFLANMGADPQRLLAAVRTVDFFVVTDYYMTPTAAACADLFLPIAMSIERTGCRSMFNPTRAISPVVTTNAHTDEDIVLDIGHRLNPEGTPWANATEFWEDVLHNIRDQAGKPYYPPDFTFDDLREKMYIWEPFEYRKYEKGLLRSDGQPGFSTPTGRFEFYSLTAEAAGGDPLPHYVPEPNKTADPEAFEEYPLYLTTGRRSWEFFHSEHRHLKSMREFHPWPRVEMTQETADKYGIQEGDWVLIENPRGSVREKCVINPSMHPDTIMAEHGWWYPERRDDISGDNPFGVFDSNINQLVPMEDYGPLGYCAPYDTQMCRISKCTDYHPTYDPGY
ncbi:molybdopterin-dependent oxidoreductase [Adlercreutzia faecimuris]|uniref:Molybdopterin-dependent oxidoreductase n=1 Tax=Adlercreutzia faecimuris TaxID=2897341 RepID=A0ABS9WKC7_9ACTN|nr:molybdopterin-dependent oxidoreductase [Adlercreutzia sp. JBNU-10]MCI2242887.1 molybdopterin-dependent oxidoreductase [Adlercreutzia sp. JBNU-10]